MKNNSIRSTLRYYYYRRRENRLYCNALTKRGIEHKIIRCAENLSISRGPHIIMRNNDCTQTRG